MEPADAALDADIAREQIGVRLDKFSHLFRLHGWAGQVESLAEDVRRQIDAILLLDELAPVTAKALLVGVVSVAIHRHLHDVSADDQQTPKEIGV